MHDETRARVEEEIKNWNYLAELPEVWHGFQIDRRQQVVDDVYDFCSYTNAAAHRSITLYYHEETHEYKLRVKLGLVEFCRIEFITAKLPAFEELLRDQFEGLLLELSEYDPASLSSIVLEKGITTWEYTASLPKSCEGFELFVSPEQPTKINNGSYVIINYVDFVIESDFAIYYNVYRDEFFGEARIWNIPDVNYDFDAVDLTELIARLREGMVPRLQEIRSRAEAEVTKHNRGENNGCLNQ